MYIYKFVNDVNDKIYVGQTTESLEHRFKRHMGYQKDEHDTKFYRAVRKYGVEHFSIHLLDTATNREELDCKEEYWIKKLDAINSGYNTALGKVGGDTLSHNPNLAEIREKISKSKLGGKNPNSTAVYCIYLKTGLKRYFSSMSECQNALDIPRHDIIRRRCIGKITKPYKGKYMFEYA